MGDKSFIEVQFPVSKISKESYKERKAGSSQTLTGLGKWWGRKPLILIRATILGLLLPSTENPVEDNKIFLKLLTMDDNGLLLRKNKSIPIAEVYINLSEYDKNNYFELDKKEKPIYKRNISQDIKDMLQNKAFLNLSYDDKLKYCLRPEEVKLSSCSEWEIINTYLDTNATSLQELIQQLGVKKFGNNVKIGDCFAGGGSIPFEASRMGCEAYASDLNPIACLLNWANFNILSNSDAEINKLYEFMQKVYDEVDKQILEWGIETNELGERGIVYLYCNETVCPECGYKVPLAPSWTISKKEKTIAILKENNSKGFDIDIITNPTREQEKESEKNISIKNGKLKCPHCGIETSISAIRGDRKLSTGDIIYGLRKWESTDIVPREQDVFKERLYCIRYENEDGKKRYVSPSENDFEREKKVIDLVNENFKIWQQKGILPSMEITPGVETSRLQRERGWMYWHQLFNPRQLLVNGLLAKYGVELANSIDEYIISIINVNKCIDKNARLSIWHNSGSVKVESTFANQALNTLFNYGCRGFMSMKSIIFCKFKRYNPFKEKIISLKDARDINDIQNIWITDPPYADAVNYHELSEFFLAWDKKIIEDVFREWYTDSKRVLAVKGKGENFNHSMIEIYSNLAKNTTDNGMQVVMFTHSNVDVWANLALILWSSGLQVTAAWNIATETESGGLKASGNYVKGTVILVLRKQNSDNTAYIDELYPEIEDEVKSQIDTMRDLDDKDDPNFTDADYLLAAYAASLKVLTSYKNIEDIDVKYELSKSDGESPIVNIINDAVKIAFDYLTPNGFDSYTWKTLLPEERFYIEGLDTEKNNVYKLSAYQELGRGFGVNEYSDMMANTKANKARLKTASEFAMKYTNDNTKFGHSILRNVLVALYKSTKEEEATKGKAWLRNEVDDYWNERSKIIEILDYIATLEHIENMKHWEKDAKSAKILVELIRNDGV